MARRRKPARPQQGLIPLRLARFDPADWPPTTAEPDHLTGSGEFAGQVARAMGRRRWNRARARFAAEHGMTIGDLRGTG